MHISTTSWRRRAGLPVLVAAVALIAAGCVGSAAPPPPPPKTVLFYGDSLTNQSKSVIVSRMQKQAPGWRVVVKSFGGTAMCDWLTDMRNASGENAKVIVIQLSGNAFTECMTGILPETQQWLNKYRADAAAAANIWKARGARVLFVGSPRGVCRPVPHPLDAVYQSVAAQYGMTFSDAPERALTVTLEPAPPTEATEVAEPPVYAAGEAPEPSVQALTSWPCATPDVPTEVFAFEMPCLPIETAAHGCRTVTAADGSTQSVIQVRDGTPSAPGGHFECPGYTGTGWEPCTSYSGGISRFAGAIATETVKLLT